MTSTQLIPALVIPFLAWRVYIRVRRNIGRQLFHPKRTIVRIVIFSILSLLFGVGALAYLPSLSALGGGLLVGAPLALIGLHLTKFEKSPSGQKYYTPNTAIGVALSVLFVGRIGYRIFVLMIAPPTDGTPAPELFHSPLTLFIFGLTAGYYIAYYAGVLIRGEKLA